VELVQAIIENDAAWGLTLINEAIDGGADPRQFGRQVIEHLRQMLLIKMAGEALVDVTDERRKVLREQSEAIGRKALLTAIRTFNTAVQEWQGGWQPQLPLELAFLESIKPVVEDEPAPAARPYVRTQDDLPKPIERPPAPAAERAIPVGDIKAQWIQVQKHAKQYDRVLPALLEHARPRDLQGDVLVLGVQNAVFKPKIEEADKLNLLSQILQEMFGVALRIKVIVVTTGSEHDQAVDDLLAQDDLLAYGVDELGGEIEDFEE
jgi:DNA polymerase-3 subunit gamma/tau